MEKKHIALGIGGALGAAVAWKLLTREDTAEFEDALDYIHHPDHSNFVEVDGVKVHFQEFGVTNDPVMLLIHGFSASTYTWNVVAPMFAEAGYRVIAVDLLGHGYSEKPGWFDYKVASQARMIHRFMNLLGIGKATIVASSYGGAVASWFALDEPERVDKLVLVGAVINDRPMSHPVPKVLTQPGVGDAMTPFVVDSRAFVKFRMQGNLDPSNHHLITEERIDAILRPLKAKDAHRALLTTLRNWDAERIERDAHLIEKPTLLIWGENDQVIPKGNGEKLYDRVLDSKFIVIKDCGHLPQEEEPRLFVELVLQFCKDKELKGARSIEDGNGEDAQDDQSAD